MKGEKTIIGRRERADFPEIGLFKVSYRAVSADGHVITGKYEFTVSPKAVTTMETKSPEANSSSTGSDKKLSIYLIISATLVVGGALLLFFIWKRQSK